MIDIDEVLAKSRANNTRDEVTGLLFTDGHRFLQVLEGPQATVEDTFLRIIADPRHRALVLLSRRAITRREFGDWSMARRKFGETPDALSARIAALCRGADASVHGTFQGLIDARKTA